MFGYKSSTESLSFFRALFWHACSKLMKLQNSCCKSSNWLLFSFSSLLYLIVDSSKMAKHFFTFYLISLLRAIFSFELVNIQVGLIPPRVGVWLRRTKNHFQSGNLLKKMPPNWLKKCFIFRSLLSLCIGLGLF